MISIFASMVVAPKSVAEGIYHRHLIHHTALATDIVAGGIIYYLDSATGALYLTVATTVILARIKRTFFPTYFLIGTVSEKRSRSLSNSKT